MKGRYSHLRGGNSATDCRVKRLDINLFDDVECSVVYGGCVKDGVLTPDLNCRSEQWFDGYTPEVSAAFYSASLKIYYVVQSAAVVEKSESDEYFVRLCDPVSSPWFCEEYDGEKYRVLMFGASEGRALTRRIAEDFTPEYSLLMGVRHHHRLFAIDGDDALLVRWSGYGSSLDWSEGINNSGYVRLGGGLGGALQIISYGALVVILREKGLTCLTALGAPENFKITDLPAPSQPVYKGTAAVCGDSLYFYSEGGIMRFDGDGITAVGEPFNWRISSAVCAAGRGGKYLLGCGDFVYCYDTDGGAGYFIDCPATVFLNGEKLMAFGDGSVNFIDSEQPSVTWESVAFDFERAGRKTINGLFLICEGSVTAEISNGRTKRSITGGGGYYNVGLSGERFTVKISSSSPVGGVSLYAEVCDGT